MSASASYFVDGMTCDHCVRAVRTELGALDGVASVDVDLATGKVDITSAEPLSPEAVAAAVEEAGYTVR